MLLVLIVGAVTGIRRDHDDMSVEEMLRRESRDADQTEYESSIDGSSHSTSEGLDMGALPVLIRNRPRRTKQQASGGGSSLLLLLLLPVFTLVFSCCHTGSSVLRNDG
uniref:Uncharacterized protein n=1 Tax=Anopheles maculatus TaxID=74869 RepID=A0A182S9R7_9DIPT